MGDPVLRACSAEAIGVLWNKRTPIPEGNMINLYIYNNGIFNPVLQRILQNVVQFLAFFVEKSAVSASVFVQKIRCKMQNKSAPKCDAKCDTKRDAICDEKVGVFNTCTIWENQ